MGIRIHQPADERHSRSHGCPVSKRPRVARLVFNVPTALERINKELLTADIPSVQQAFGGHMGSNVPLQPTHEGTASWTIKDHLRVVRGQREGRVPPVCSRLLRSRAPRQ